MKNNVNLLVEGLERLGMMAVQIRKKGNSVSELDLDVLMSELRSLYREALNTIPNDSLYADEPSEGGEPSLVIRDAEEAAAKKAAEEAAAKKAAEEAAARKAAEEAAAKKAAEEAAAKKAAEEAAAKKAAEEAAARKAAEEAAAKKAAEEAAAKKAAEEAAARKAAEEAARKAAEEAKPLFAPEETTEIADTKAPSMMESIEGNANDTLFSGEPPVGEEPPQVIKVDKGRPAVGSLFSYLSEAKEEKPTVRTIGDTLNMQTRSVEEQLEKRVNAKKVDDLRTIININDKFSFMSELFRNNMKAYNDFILRLNAYTDRAEALAYVEEVAAQYSWNNESLAVKSFYKIFDRKF